MATLAFAQLDPKQQHFVRLLSDPARSGDSLAVICRAAGFKASELIEVFRKASFAKAQAIAIGRAADAIPGVVDDLASKAVDREGRCPACNGRGDSRLPGAPCATCSGSGRAMIDSDHDRQKTLLDMLGLGKKQAPGTKIINTNAQINAGVGQMFSTFVKATDTDAYDVDSPVLDAEVADGREG